MLFLSLQCYSSKIEISFFSSCVMLLLSHIKLSRMSMSDGNQKVWSSRRTRKLVHLTSSVIAGVIINALIKVAFF